MDSNQSTPILQTEVSPVPKKVFPVKLIALIGGGLLVVILFFVIKSFVSKDISTSLSSEITWWGYGRMM